MIRSAASPPPPIRDQSRPLPTDLRLSVQQSVELGERAQRQGVRQRRLGVLPQPPRLQGGAAAAVTRHQEAGQDGAQEEGHQHAGDQQGEVDVGAGALVRLRKMTNTWKTQEVGELKGYYTSYCVWLDQRSCQCDIIM